MTNTTYSVTIGTLVGKEKMAEIRKAVKGKRPKPAHKKAKPH